jgi:MFS family permease
MKNIPKLHLISFLKGFNFYAPFYTLYFLAHGEPLSWILFTQGFYSVFAFLSEVPTGVFADKYGHKTAIVVGNIVNAFGVLSIGLFPSTAGLILNNAVQGVGEAFLSGSQEAIYYESFKKEKSGENYQKFFGKYLSLATIGFILSTFIAGGIMQFFQEGAYLPLILINTTSILITAGIASTLRGVKAEITNPAEGVKAFDAVKTSFRFIRSNRTVFALTAVGMLTLNGEYILRETYQSLFQDIHVPLFLIGFSLSAGAMVNIIVKRYAYLAEKFFSLEKILLLFNITLGMLYILLAVSVNPLFSVGLYVVLQGFYNAELPIVSDYVNEQISPNIRATVLSSISLAKSFVSILLRIVLSIAIALVGLQNSLYLLGIYIIIGILIGYYILTKCGCTYKIKSHQQA